MRRAAVALREGHCPVLDGRVPMFVICDVDGALRDVADPRSRLRKKRSHIAERLACLRVVVPGHDPDFKITPGNRAGNKKRSTLASERRSLRMFMSFKIDYPLRRDLSSSHKHFALVVFASGPIERPPKQYAASFEDSLKRSWYEN